MTAGGITKDAMFEVFNCAVPGSRPQPMYRIRCKSCGERDSIGAGRKRLPTDVIARKFEARGWLCHARDRASDLCSNCKPHAHPKKEKPNVKSPAPALTVVSAAPLTAAQPAVTTPTVAFPAADRPEEPTREDKRVIFAKLNDVYVDERTGYSPGWTDERVAKDLCVPRAWVSNVREENFGPEASNEEIRGLIAQGRTMVEDIRRFDSQVASVAGGIASLTKTQKALETQATPLSMQADRLEKHLTRITKMLGI